MKKTRVVWGLLFFVSIRLSGESNSPPAGDFFEKLKVDFPELLSQTALFQDLGETTPASGLLPYDVSSALWSDGAEKSRWMAIPEGKKIHFSSDQHWEFPEGSVFVKQFIVIDARENARHLETRVFVKRAKGFQGMTYRWNREQTDAIRLPQGAEETIDSSGDSPGASPGDSLGQIWSYPSQNQCLTCHSMASGSVLGINTRQLNHSVTRESGSINQLTWLSSLGLFDLEITHPENYPSYPKSEPPDGNEPDKDLAARARVYLEVNCAHCHSPEGAAPGGMDLRASVPTSDMQIVGAFAADSDLGISNAYRVDPGSKETSVLWLRMGRTDSFRMPKLGSHVVDQEGIELIGAWIDGGAQ